VTGWTHRTETKTLLAESVNSPHPLKMAIDTIVEVSSIAQPTARRAIAGLPFRTAVVYALLFFAAFCIYAALWSAAPVMEPDSGSYMKTAQDLSDFRVGQVNDRAPGYPLLLVITSSAHAPARTLLFVSLCLHSLCVWFLAVVLFRLGVGEVMLWFFALLLLLPPYVEPAAYVLTENLAEAMLVIGFGSFAAWVLGRGTGWLVGSAAAFGYAGLTRPTYQLLGCALVAYLVAANYAIYPGVLKWKAALKANVVVLCGSVVLMGGYVLLNYRFVGQAGVSPVLGLALTQKTIRVVERLPDEDAKVRDVLIRARNTALLSDPRHTGSAYIESTIPELMKVTGLNKAQLSAYLLRLNLLLIRTAPAEYLHEVVWAFGSYWFPAAGPLANFESRPVQLLWGAIHVCVVAGFALGLVLLAGATAYIRMASRLLREIPPSVTLTGLIYGLAGVIVFYTAAISCLVQDGLPRYRVPTDALIVFMAVLGFRLWGRLIEISRMPLSGGNTICL
jgi:hypothetical protein